MFEPLSNLPVVLLVAAISIISALAAYAIYLLQALKKQRQHQQQLALAQQQALITHDKKTLASVAIIARAMQAEQCELSEGCWRICGLLASMKVDNNHQQNFPAIFGLYQAIKELSILEARKQLTKQARMKEDLARLKAEAEFNDDILTELPKLLAYADNYPKSLITHN